MNLWNLLFVSRCKLCDSVCGKGSVCDECDAKLKEKVFVSRRDVTVNGKNIRASYVFDYDDELVKKLLFALKRRADKDLFRYASRLYEIALPPDFAGVVTNVPRSKINVRDYGYDHVKEPCKILCNHDRQNRKYLKVVRRKGSSEDQKYLSCKERAENVKNKFAATKKDITSDILLIDDVVTTASTVTCCAEEMMKHNPDATLYMAFLASGSI